MKSPSYLPNPEQFVSSSVSHSLPDLAQDLSPKDAVTAVNDWLMDQVLGDATAEDLLNGALQALQNAGFPITRAFFAFKVLHPLFDSLSFVWRKGQDIDIESHTPNEEGTENAFLNSPQNYLISQAQKTGLNRAEKLRLRRRLRSRPGPARPSPAAWLTPIWDPMPGRRCSGAAFVAATPNPSTPSFGTLTCVTPPPCPSSFRRWNFSNFSTAISNAPPAPPWRKAVRY